MWNIYYRNLLIVTLLLSSVGSVEAQCEQCPPREGAEEIDYCFRHKLFPEKCAQFMEGKGFFFFTSKKKYVQIPLADKADLDYFLKLATNREYKKLEKTDLLFLQEALVAWETAKLDIGYSFTDSGLGIKIMEEGNGEVTKKGQRLTVHYTGYLKDGSKFDSSIDRGQPFKFPLGAGRVIKGWDEGMQNLKIGTKAMLKVPPQLGYGSRPTGSIPPNSTLYFEVEVLEAE